MTKYRLELFPGARSKTVKALWDKEDINTKWQESRWCKKLQTKHLRSKMTDFDRFKLLRAKQAYNRMLAQEYTRLKSKNKAQLADKVKKRKPRKFVAKSQRIANKFKIFKA